MRAHGTSTEASRRDCVEPPQTVAEKSAGHDCPSATQHGKHPSRGFVEKGTRIDPSSMIREPASHVSGLQLNITKTAEVMGIYNKDMRISRAHIAFVSSAAVARHRHCRPRADQLRPAHARERPPRMRRTMPIGKSTLSTASPASPTRSRPTEWGGMASIKTSPKKRRTIKTATLSAWSVQLNSFVSRFIVSSLVRSVVMPPMLPARLRIIEALASSIAPPPLRFARPPLTFTTFVTPSASPSSRVLLMAISRSAALLLPPKLLLFPPPPVRSVPPPPSMRLPSASYSSPASASESSQQCVKCWTIKVTAQTRRNMQPMMIMLTASSSEMSVPT